jgi:proline iminopeptidase
MLNLTEDEPLLFYDQRGGGRSRTNSREAITWHSHVADLGALVAEFDVTPFTLIGYSWGGLLAMLYAVQAAAPGSSLRQPDRMILMDPAPVTRELRHDFEVELARRQADPRLQAMRAELSASGLRERDPDAYRQRAFELSVAGYFADPERAQELTPFRVIGRVQQSVWESLGSYDLRPELASVQAPVLLVHGRQDPIPVAASQQAASALPHAQLVILDDCGHVPYVEQPDALFSNVRQFLAATHDNLLQRYRNER